MSFLASIEPGTWALFGAFWSLVLGTAWFGGGVSVFFNRKMDDWMLDGVSLFVQGAVIPLCQVFLVAALLSSLAPSTAGSLVLDPLLSFALCFVGVDYLYYWNHRILHTPKPNPLKSP